MSNKHYTQINHYQCKDKLIPIIVEDADAREHLSNSVQDWISKIADTASLLNKDASLTITRNEPRAACYKDADNAADIYPAMVVGQIVIESNYQELPLKLTTDIVIRNSAERNVNIDFDWSLQAEDVDGFDISTDDIGDIFGCLDGDYYTVSWLMNNEKKLNQHLSDMRDTAIEVFERITSAFCIGVIPTPKLISIESPF